MTHSPRAADGRLQPLRALSAVHALVADPEHTEHVFEILDALRGRSLERGLARLSRVRPDLVAARRELLPILADREHLAALPEGSFGRAYLDFCLREGITADGLVEASDNVRTREGAGVAAWYERRGRDSHDLWHVLTGYGTDTLGEVCVVGYTFVQTGHLGLGVIALAGALKHVPELGWRGSFGPLLEALRHGRRSAWLPAMDWSALLALPLTEVREQLAIRRPRAYERCREPAPHATAALG